MHESPARDGAPEPLHRLGQHFLYGIMFGMTYTIERQPYGARASGIGGL
jgi:hypothetical protein